MLRNKNILIGITGGIAAYKICELVRMFKKNDANVKVVLTPSAKEFVTELTMDTLSQERVYTEQFNTSDKKPDHIALCDWADLFVIAPASANTIGKLASGIADNLLTSLACAFKGTMLIAPAMNTGMWENRFVQKNIKALKNAGMHIVEPESGFLACGTCGKGRLASVEKVFNEAALLLYENRALKGKKIIITAGGTRENIDPVRYIGNYSSGKMGKALADSAYNAGADVVLVCTFEETKPYKTVCVNSAEEMEDAVKKESQNADCVIMAAAVADYRPAKCAESKIKKDKNEELIIKLVKNPDILANLCKNKKENQIIVGFCAESDDLIENAKEKFAKKGCDFLVANDITRKDIAFSSDYNEVYILSKDSSTVKIDRDTKENIAKRILETIFRGEKSGN